MVTREQALDAFKHEPRLAEIYQLEHNRIEALLDTALKYNSPEYRWECYEALKSFSLQFVGRNAERSELRTPGHYEVLLGYIDWLLPESEAVL